MSDSATTAPPLMYDPRVLLGVIQSLNRPFAFLLNSAFPTLILHETIKVQIDLEIGANRPAAFCSPEVEGRIISERGYDSRDFEPGYTKEKSIITPRNSFKRRAGEVIGLNGGQYTPMERHMLRLADSINEKVAAITTRKEIMAAQVLATGKCIVEGEGIPRTEVNYKRDPSLTIQLTGEAAWDQPGADPVGDLEDVCDLVAQRKGGVIARVAMGPTAFRLAQRSEEFRKQLKMQRADSGVSGLTTTLGPQTNINLTVNRGMWGNVEIWVYSGYWEDPKTGTQYPFVADNGVVGWGDYLEGRQLQGAIQDLGAQLQPREYFVSSWPSYDPSGQMVMVQSAPLVAPFRPNNSFGMTVTDPS